MNADVVDLDAWKHARQARTCTLLGCERPTSDECPTLCDEHGPQLYDAVAELPALYDAGSPAWQRNTDRIVTRHASIAAGEPYEHVQAMTFRQKADLLWASMDYWLTDPGAGSLLAVLTQKRNAIMRSIQAGYDRLKSDQHDALAPAVVIAAALGIPVARIERWAERHAVKPQSVDLQGVPLYRLGDVLELAGTDNVTHLPSRSDRC